MILTNTISRLFGKFASKEFSPFTQKVINWGYVKFLGLDMSEFQSPSEYKTLNKLFTRELQTPRKLPTLKSKFISPTDSFITAVGKITKGTALQIKGMEYSVSRLLGERVKESQLGRLEGGLFLNFYLSPKDYHHYHMPFDAEVKRAFHFGGKLDPVNIPYLNKKIDLFVENERVVLECVTSENKLFYMVLVGALNVGEMVVNFEPKIETNHKAGTNSSYSYENLHLKRGDDLGYFKMGSTVVILAEKGFLTPLVGEFEKVRFGTVVADANDSSTKR